MQYLNVIISRRRAAPRRAVLLGLYMFHDARIELNRLAAALRGAVLRITYYVYVLAMRFQQDRRKIELPLEQIDRVAFIGTFRCSCRATLPGKILSELAIPSIGPSASRLLGALRRVPVDSTRNKTAS